MANGGGFKRVLTFGGCMWLMVGGIISTWLYILPGIVGGLAGPSSLLAWIVGAILTVAIGLCYAELATAFPKAGGPAVYPYETLGGNKAVGSFLSCLEGVCVFFGNLIFVIITAIMMAAYLCMLIPGAAAYTGIIAAIFVILAYVVNLLGIKSTRDVNLGMLVMLIAVLAACVISFFINIEPANFQPFFLHGTAGFVACLPMAVTSFGAWVTICSIAEEIKEPEKTIPKVILCTIAVALVIQVIVMGATFGVVPPTAFVEGSAAMAAPLGYAAKTIGYRWLITLIPISALLAGFTSVLVGMLGASRPLVALGRNETFPKAFASLTKRGIPGVALTLVAVVSVVLACFPEYFFKILVVGVLIGTGLPFGINIVSYIGLRYWRGDIEPAFRAPGGYVLPVIAFIVLGIGCVGLGSMEVLWSLVALAVILGYFGIRALTHPCILR